MSFKSAFSLSHTSAVQQHVAKHQKILYIILSVSPAKIQPHIKDCVIKHNKLMVYVNSAVWASQLRFFHTQIKEAVNQQSIEKVEHIRIRILPPASYQRIQKSNKIIPSAKNIDLLSHHAQAISEGKLKNALLKLSNTLRQHKQ